MADIPNHWQPTRPAASGVIAAVNSCLESSRREQPTMMGVFSEWGQTEYCGCLMDYFFSLGPLEKLTIKQLTDEHAKAAATWCFNFAKGRFPAKK